MKQVLRNNEDGSISHIYFCTFNATNIYLTKKAYDLVNFEFNEEIVSSHYSGDTMKGYNVMKEDLSTILTGETPINVLKLNIARSNGLIEPHEVIEING